MKFWSEILLLLPFQNLKEEYMQLELGENFTVSAIVHPSTYLNKILLGSEEGALQLWNIKTG